MVKVARFNDTEAKDEVSFRNTESSFKSTEEEVRYIHFTVLAE